VKQRARLLGSSLELRSLGAQQLNSSLELCISVPAYFYIPLA
jgi:hypothetical protein